MHDRFDKNEVIPVLVSTNNSNLSFFWRGGGESEVVGGRGLCWGSQV